MRPPLTAIRDYLDLLEREVLPENAWRYLEQRGIVPSISLPEEPVIRFLDSSAVGRIFENIISDALKYSDGDLAVSLDEGGTVSFSNSAYSLDPVSAVRLFDRFYTVESGHGSTRLGLSISKLLIQRMGGNHPGGLPGGAAPYHCIFSRVQR